MLHTCICGPPGVGKTELGRCFGKIYRKLGILSNDTFKIFTRSDLVGEYLGQTAIKTQKCIDECKGGVMFIDEAYSLGNEEKRDSFSKECIDTINQNLSEKRDFLCIIAGYKESLEKCFFKYNDGLNRRFTFRYDIEPYKWDELKKIFELKVKKGGFIVYYDAKNNKCEENIKIQELFKKYKDNFNNSGGDMETLFLKSKIIHSRTILTDMTKKYLLSYNDIKKGIECLVSSREILKEEDKIPYGMYM
jgi:SpoVK/Ycf46/Vps4 family AAA+-type ATPase